MDKIIGIDLGTTNSVVGVLEGNEPVIVPNSRGDRLTPSVVAFTDKNELLVGQPAKNQAVVNSERTVLSIKRKMGSDYRIKINGKKYSPEEISSIILSRLKQYAEEYLGNEVKKAVITVPAYFNDAQRQATINAGKIAGLDVLRIINEPTAAALAYGLDTQESQKVIVFDIGGGTYDVSILEINDGVFEVLATNGNNFLGGDDFDDRLVDYILNEFQKENEIDLRLDLMALQRIKEEAIRAKVDLSEMPETNINIPFITADGTGPKHLNLKITRAKFEDLIGDLVDMIREPAYLAIEDAGIKAENIDKVLLVGGSTRVPLVLETVTSIVKKEPVKGLNPDECVAFGAAIQGGILSGEKKNIVLIDVTPLTLGIQIENGVFAPVIERNTPIPIKTKKMFTTIADNQRTVKVSVYQGERKLAKYNKLLGEFHLTGIRLAEKGEPKIEVTFDIDADGVVNVTAKDLDTGADQTIKITGALGLSEEEINKLIEEARYNEQKDRDSIKHRELKNKAEYLIYTGNEIVNRFNSDKDNIDETAVCEEINAAIEELERCMNSDDYDALEEMIDTMNELIKEFEQEKSYYPQKGTSDADGLN